MNKSSSLSREPLKRRQPKQNRGKERVEKILLAAAEVFTEVGYPAATTQQIAEKADTAVGSIYQFFPDKLAIFHALAVEHLDRTIALDRWIEDVDIDRPLVEIVDEFINGYINLMELPTSRCVVFHSLQSHIPELLTIDDGDNIERQTIARHADFYQRRNPTLSRQQSELLAKVGYHIFNSLFIAAFKSDPPTQVALYAELKDVLYVYLDPHIGDRFVG
jgi:AcrR family transcriptional regulator